MGRKSLPSVKPDMKDPISVLESELRMFSDRVEKLKHVVQGEEATKMSFIVPFLLKLGWDVYNPLEVVPEYVCDVGIRKGEKVDYALIVKETPIIIIEAKDWKQNLGGKVFGQLYRYFTPSEAKIGIISNGIEYQFYTDSVKENILDETPFFVFNLERFTYSDVELLEKFTRESMEGGGIEIVLENMQINKSVLEIQQWLESQGVQPSSAFIRMIRSNVLSVKLSSTVVAKVIKEALANISFGFTAIKDVTDSSDLDDFDDYDFIGEDESVTVSPSKSSSNSTMLDDVKSETGLYHLDSAINNYPMGCRLVGVSFDGKKWFTCPNVSNIAQTLIEYLLGYGMDKEYIVKLSGNEYPCLSLDKYSFRKGNEYKGVCYESNLNGKDHIKNFKIICERLSVVVDNVVLCFINNIEAKTNCRGLSNSELIRYVHEKNGGVI